MTSPVTSRFIIGIDLGTTHCAVTFIDLQKKPTKREAPQLFEIDQLVGPGEIGRRALLPSFAFLNHDSQVSEADSALPWHSALLQSYGNNRVIVGTWARELGAQTQGRLVHSAKSWLCHEHVDREDAILPWTEDVPVSEKISPVDAVSLYLDHIKHAWNYHHPDHPLEHQEVIVTIPASFDDMARNLTLIATKKAGVTTPLLLEEPQAVFYDWLFHHQQNANHLLKAAKLILVVDVGGGTTDFSLLSVNTNQSSIPEIVRIGVGDHLMLGGDNIDLALAHIAENQLLSSGKKLRTSALSQLIQQTRLAKEKMLRDEGLDSYPVTILGTGSKLIGGKTQTQLQAIELNTLVFDGYFKSVGLGELPATRKTAIVEFGLPYAADPNIVKHISAFLAKHQSICRDALGQNAESAENQPIVPDTVIFNGGVFNSQRLRDHLYGILKGWGQNPVQMLDNNRPDLSVAYGAAIFGLAKKGQFAHIEGGAARSYFLVIDDDNTRKAISILSKGTPEDTWIEVPNQQFALRLGEPVQFQLASSTADERHVLGSITELTSEMHVLPPLVTQLTRSIGDQTSVEGTNSEISVELQAKMSGIGLFSLRCVSGEGQSWDLEFLTRQSARKISDKESSAPELPSGFPLAQDKIALVFGPQSTKQNVKELKLLRQDLEKILGKRENWETHLSRCVFQELLKVKKGRLHSAYHERLWFNLAGYTLRPGIGTEIDSYLIEESWPLYQQGLKFKDENQSWSEWWIFWRRISAGLTADHQTVIAKSILQYLNPAVLRSRKTMTELKVKSYEDIVQLFASLENLSQEDKKTGGQHILSRLKNNRKEPLVSWWALGRIGARLPFYAPANKVVPTELVSPWIRLALAQDWKKEPGSAFSACMMARKTENRVLDIDDDLRAAVISKLVESKLPESWQTMVHTKTDLDEKESKRVFGESLPSGLKLI